jgi:hypothetical protein
MLSTAINAIALFHDRFTQLCWVLASVRSDSSKDDSCRNPFGYNPHHRESTPQEKLAAMDKNQGQQGQPSRDREKSRVYC